MDRLTYLKGVATLGLDAERCNGCGMCLDVCPHAVLTLAEKKVRLDRPDACMECGACAKNCPAGAIHVDAGVGCAAAVLSGGITGRAACCGPADPLPD